MKLSIREAVSDDYLNISKLTLEVHSLHLKNRPDVYLDISNPLAKEYFDNLLSDINTKIFVAENTVNKELAAYSILKAMSTQSIPILVPQKFVYIDDFSVNSKYRKNGIGKLLFNHIVEYSKSISAASLQLTVWEFNKDAIKFYEAMGMKTRNRRLELKI